MSAVPACSIASWDDNRFAARNALDLPFQNPQLRRIDQVVLKIDGYERGDNAP